LISIAAIMARRQAKRKPPRWRFGFQVRFTLDVRSFFMFAEKCRHGLLVFSPFAPDLRGPAFDAGNVG
jgi:hypothetical protein